MSCKQYRYARSPYFHASRHAMLVKTKTIGARPPAKLKFQSHRARAAPPCALEGSVMIQPIWPLLQAPRDKVEFRRMQIPGRWIHSQGVFISAGRNTLGRADRGGIEEQLREESRTVTRGCASKGALKHVEGGDFRGGRICRQIEHRHALVMTKRIRHVCPVEIVPRSPQRFNAMLGSFVIFVPCHC